MTRGDPFTISRHANRRMRQRGITATQVQRVLSHPDATYSDRDDPSATHALKRIHIKGGSLILRIVYNHLRQQPHIITVFFDRRLRRKS